MNKKKKIIVALSVCVIGIAALARGVSYTDRNSNAVQGKNDIQEKDFSTANDNKISEEADNKTRISSETKSGGEANIALTEMNSSMVSKYAYADKDTSVPENIDVLRDDVEYGEINDRISYYSSTIGENKECGVLLPAGYSEQNKYPVMYILHGNGGDHYDWNREDSFLKTLCGNMVADKTAVPAIVVMVDMWTAPASEKEGTTLERQLNAYDEFYKDLGNDLIPFIEKNYSVATDRDSIAIIGTSMGATEALIAGYKLMDKIGYMAALAPCPGVVPYPEYGESIWNTPVLESFNISDKSIMPYYIQLTIGDQDPWCYETTLQYDEDMKALSIPHDIDVVEGMSHENALWEHGVYNFYKRIFK